MEAPIAEQFPNKVNNEDMEKNHITNYNMVIWIYVSDNIPS